MRPLFPIFILTLKIAFHTLSCSPGCSFPALSRLLFSSIFASLSIGSAASWRRVRGRHEHGCVCARGNTYPIQRAQVRRFCKSNKGSSHSLFNRPGAVGWRVCSNIQSRVRKQLRGQSLARVLPYSALTLQANCCVWNAPQALRAPLEVDRFVWSTRSPNNCSQLRSGVHHRDYDVFFLFSSFEFRSPSK